MSTKVNDERAPILAEYRCKENQTLTLPPGFVIQNAWYGHPKHEWEIGHMLGSDVTASLSSSYDVTIGAVVKASNHAFGDPATGVGKILIVTRETITETVWRKPDAPKLELSEDRRTATDTATDPTTGDQRGGKRYRCVIAEQGFSTGKHSWDIRVDKRGRFETGVVTGNVLGSACDLHANREAWVICVGAGGEENCARWHADQQVATHLPAIPEGSVINVRLDCNARQRTLTFSINGVGGSDATCKLAAGQTYFPVVAFGGDGTRGNSLTLLRSLDEEALLATEKAAIKKIHETEISEILKTHSLADIAKKLVLRREQLPPDVKDSKQSNDIMLWWSSDTTIVASRRLHQ